MLSRFTTRELTVTIRSRLMEPKLLPVLGAGSQRH
jgi:hypothetical protein